MNVSLRAVGLASAALLLSIAASWPLAAAPGQWFASDPTMPDLNASMWLPSHILWAAAGETGLWQADELLWPSGQRIDLLIWNLGAQLLQLPLYAVLSPIAAYNTSLVAMGALNGLAGYVLGRQLGGPAAGGAAGAVLLFSPYAWNELVQGRVEQGLLAGVALTVAALLSMRQQPSPRAAVAAGLAWAATGLCYWFYAYFLLLLAVPLGLLALARRQREQARDLLITGATAALVAAPFAVSLLLRAVQQQSVYSQSTADDVQPLVRSVIGGASVAAGGLLWPLRAPEFLRDAIPITALMLVAAAVAGPIRRRAGWLLPVAVGGLLLAMGRLLMWAPSEPVLIGGMQLTMPFAGLQAALPGFERLWWPYRWLSFFYVGAAGCAAALVAAVPRRAKPVLAAALAAGLLGELRLTQAATRGGLIWDAPTPASVPALFAEVAAAPEGTAVLLLPYQGMTSNRLLWQAYFRQPTSAGLGDAEAYLLSPEQRAFVDQTPALRMLRALGRRPPSAPQQRVPYSGDLPAELRALGFGYVLLWTGSAPLSVYDPLLGAPSYKDDTVVIWAISPRAGGPL